MTLTLTGTTAAGAITPVSVDTDTDGAYSFDGLVPGTYTVTLDAGDLVSGATSTTGGFVTTTIVVESAQAATSIDFGVAAPVSIGDFVFDDVDGDGVFDLGEPGIDGVDVTITGSSPGASHPGGLTIATLNGVYQFSDLLPGDYDVVVDGSTVPAGMAASSPTTVSGTYESGDDVDSVDFGFIDPVSIGDFVFDDLDGDGSVDAGEPGLAGVTLELTGPGVPVGTTTATTAGGAYSFDDLAPGTYTVAVTSVPAGYTNTLGGASQSTTVTSGNGDDAVDFGYTAAASIGDFVFDDLDGDGVHDSGEPGIDGVVVEISGGLAGPVTTTTASGGAYDFTDLEPGTYTLEIVSGLPAGAVETLGTGGVTVTLVSNETNNDIDFGAYTLGSIGDYVWEDLDGNGLQDDGPAATVGFENVTLTLTGSTASGPIAPVSVDTDADGAYSFDDLVPGTYTVTLDTGDLAAGAMSTTGGFVMASIVVESGQAATAIDFGVAEPVSIGDLVWGDADGTGTFSAGDSALVGVTVTLTGSTAGGPIVPVTDVTDASGLYRFDNLLPGSYTVTVSTATGDLSGDELSTTGGDSQTVTLSSGESDVSLDFGYAELAAIGDRLFRDLNGNGVQDAGEPGIADVDITIVGTTAGARIRVGSRSRPVRPVRMRSPVCSRAGTRSRSTAPIRTWTRRSCRPPAATRKPRSSRPTTMSPMSISAIRFRCRSVTSCSTTRTVTAFRRRFWSWWCDSRVDRWFTCGSGDDHD